MGSAGGSNKHGQPLAARYAPPEHPARFQIHCEAGLLAYGLRLAHPLHLPAGWQWYIEGLLTVYSCGGSHGLPCSLLASTTRAEEPRKRAGYAVTVSRSIAEVDDQPCFVIFYASVSGVLRRRA